MKPFDGSIDQIFYGQYEEEWFEDSFVKRMIKEIDESEVISSNFIQSPVLGPITFERLSGGVKVLIMLYKMPEMQQWGSSCGDNCMPLMAEISKLQDITVKFSHCPSNFPKDIKARFCDDGEIISNSDDLELGIIDRLNKELEEDNRGEEDDW
jgi:hypothetical protein